MVDPSGAFDGKFLGAVFEQAGSSDMFRFKSANVLTVDEVEACKVAANVMPAFKVKEDDDHEEHDDEDGHEGYEHDGHAENESDRRNDKAER